ncbi:sulfate transporter 1.3-like isoform X1 [Papaver somniferum]|uniref:sulfate transporter 1.3-like isoform X1 n=1 Tax=Papaver somniferum TaxID=3469 RepID=UPI000E7041F6|nr:sulfate transporter 1.3-like isoform X1 [Papaver somniferum]
MGHSILSIDDKDDGSMPPSRRHANGEPNVQKVAVPPKQNMLKDIKSITKEFLFSDEPLRPFKNQTIARKFLIGLQTLFPILEWGREYTLSKLKNDLVAGITIASLSIPQDIGYSKLANLEPHYGLYTSFVPPLVYACMGTSRDIAIGAVSVISLLLGTQCSAEADPIKNPIEYHNLVFTATFFAGLVQFLFGFFRLGFLVDFLSHAALVGFMGGAAIVISAQQLALILGIRGFTKKNDIVSVMQSVFGSMHHGWNWQSAAIGTPFLAFLFLATYLGSKNRKFFWLSAIAPSFCVVTSTVIVYLTRVDRDDVQIVNYIRKGINPVTFQDIYFSGKYLAAGMRIGAVVGMIALSEAIAIGRTFAGLKNYKLDSNKEMLAMGSMNMVGSMTSCYVSTGSFSRSAVNNMSGCKTPVSNIVMSGVVLLTLLVITPLFKYTPKAILGAVVISAVLTLLDYKEMIRIYKIDKFDFVACMGAFMGVVFTTIEMGLLIAIVISVLKILLQVTRPRTALLGKIPRTTIYRSVEEYPDAYKVPGVLIVRVDSAIYFPNSNYVKERILRWLVDEEEHLTAKGLPQIRHLIVDMSYVTDIDTTGINELELLFRTLQSQDVQLILVNPGASVMDKLHSSKIENVIGPSNIYLTVTEAVKRCNPKTTIDEV